MKRISFFFHLTVALFFSLSSACADSRQIRRDFFTQLEKEQNFGAYDLDIEVIAGVVTARGKVSSLMAKARVNEIAESIKGVDRVINNVTVEETSLRKTATSSVTDLIVERARRELKNESFSLNVTLNGKDLLLKGNVATLDGSRSIVRIAEDVAPGYVVRNQLLVKEEVLTDQELKTRVLKALALDPQVRTDDLTISAENGVVSIAGSRPEHRSIDRILSTVIMVEGVKDVKSSVKITHP